MGGMLTEDFGTLIRWNPLPAYIYNIPQRQIYARIRITGEMMDNGFGNELSKYADSQGAYPGTMARMPTLKERIALAVTQAQEKLAAVREAQEIFDRNPDLERLLNLMQKNHF